MRNYIPTVPSYTLDQDSAIPSLNYVYERNGVEIAHDLAMFAIVLREPTKDGDCSIFQLEIELSVIDIAKLLEVGDKFSANANAASFTFNDKSCMKVSMMPEREIEGQASRAICYVTLFIQTPDVQK